MSTHTRRRLAVWIFVVGAVCAAACGTTARHLPPPPTAVRFLPLGLNAGFHDGLAADVVAHYCTYGQTTYIRTPHLSGATLDAFLASVAPCPALKTLALVEGPDVDLARELARRPIDKIEIGNELELPPHEFTREQYWDFEGRACQAVREVNPTVEIVLGGVYTLDNDTRVRIRGALDRCPGATVAIHLYEELSQDDLDWLKAMLAPIIVSETGSPTGCGQAKWQEQKEWIDARRRLLSTVPNITLMVIYQWANGPGCTNLDTFGIDGKPADDLFLTR